MIDELVLFGKHYKAVKHQYPAELICVKNVYFLIIAFFRIKLFFYTKHRTHFLDICHGLPHQASIRLVSPVPNGLDVLPFGVNKGIALRFLLAQLQLLPEQVMVFGDSENDADMFLDGTFNVAVGNAYPLLKERASFVTRSSDEDGVAYAIRKFVL